MHRLAITLVLAVLLAVAVVGAPAWAQSSAPVHFRTGHELLAACQGDSQGDICTAYVEGVLDEMEAVRAWMKLAPCLPSGADSTQTHDVVVKYLTDHPELLGTNASQLVVNSVTAAWQCSR